MDKKGKVVISVLVLFILLVSLSSYFILATETNTKTYDSSTRIVTIRNGANEIATIKLNTPTVYEVVPGKDRLVAEFTIENYVNDYSNVFNDLEFYDVNNNMNQFSRVFVYKYETIENVEVRDYQTTCSERLNVNGSTEKYNCVQNQIGTHIEERVTWNDFNEEAALPEGSITLGIFTDVSQGDHVEWIPTLFGVRINEWAEWTAGLNSGLMAYYHLDEPTGTFFYSTLFGNGRNESCSAYGSTSCPTSILGKYKNATYFNGSSWLDSDNNIFNKTMFANGVTMCAWVNTSDTSGGIYNIGGFIYMGAQVASGGVIMFEVGGTGAAAIYSTSKPDGIHWAFVCGTHSGGTSNASIYFNGTKENSSSQTLDLPADKSVSIGNVWIGNDALVGTIDEVMLWNRSLSASEIAGLYDSGAGTFYSENRPPSTPTLLSPGNNSGFGMNSTITFAWSNSTDLDGDAITYDLEIYNESDMVSSHLIYSNYSMTEGAQNTSVSVKLSNYAKRNDDYYWRVRANDSTSLLSDWSGMRHFQYANWTINFNLTDSDTGQQIDTSSPQDSFDISCNNGFSVSNVENPYNATNKFAPGTWECNLSGLTSGQTEYFSEIFNFTLNNNENLTVTMSEKRYLTQEEHTWLEGLYDCVINGNCEAYNFWSNTWKRLTKTDRAVVTQETFISNTLNSGSNISLNYTINIPYKEGYASGEYLPLRLFFWFTNASNTKCYNQDKTSDSNRVENPYCFPLVAETLGPNNGTISFRVDLRPSLSEGNYNITRAIEIDPIVGGEQTWTNYGQEDIGQIKVEGINNNPSISIDNKKVSNTGFLTGAITEIGEVLSSNWKTLIITTIVCFTFIISLLIISKTILKVMGKN